MNILVLSASNIGNKTKTATEALFQTLENDFAFEHKITYLNLQEKDMQFSDGRNFLDYKETQRRSRKRL